MSRLVYGIHPVAEVLRRRGDVEVLLISKRAGLGDLVSQAEARGISITRSSVEELQALCGASSHQGVVALVGEYPYLDIYELLERQQGPPLLLAADSLMDPQNLGAIIRSGLVLGATGLVLPKKRSVQITSTVVRVSAGATEHLSCARVTNLARALDQLREAGLWVAGTVERGGASPSETDLTGPTVLVLGSEHRGIRPLVLKKCDIKLTIPSRAGIASLNVAAAATAVLYEAARQRSRLKARPDP